jgi:hypothetical protein
MSERAAAAMMVSLADARQQVATPNVVNSGVTCPRPLWRSSMRSVVQPAAPLHHQHPRGEAAFSLALRDLTYATWYAHIAGTARVSSPDTGERRDPLTEVLQPAGTGSELQAA